MIYISIHLNSWYFNSKQFLINITYFETETYCIQKRRNREREGGLFYFRKVRLTIRITFFSFLLLVKIFGKSSAPTPTPTLSIRFWRHCIGISLFKIHVTCVNIFVGYELNFFIDYISIKMPKRLDTSS